MLINNQYITLNLSPLEISKLYIDIHKNFEKEIENIIIPEDFPNVFISCNYQNIPDFNNIFSSVRILITNNISLYTNDKWLNIPDFIEYIIVKEFNTQIFKNNKNKFDFIDIILQKFSSYYNDQQIIKENLLLDFVNEKILLENINIRNIQNLSLLDLLIIHSNKNYNNPEIIKIFKFLLENINTEIINQVDNNKNTILHNALLFNKLDIAELIINNDKFTNYNIKNNNKELIIYLLVQNDNIKNNSKIIILIYNILLKSDIKLLNKLYDNNYIDNNYSLIITILFNILNYYKFYYSNKNITNIINNIIKLLLINTDNIIINKTGYYYETILHFYAKTNYNNIEIINLTLDKMTTENINLKNIHKQSAYDIACAYNNNNLINIIYERLNK